MSQNWSILCILSLIHAWISLELQLILRLGADNTFFLFALNAHCPPLPINYLSASISQRNDVFFSSLYMAMPCFCAYCNKTDGKCINLTSLCTFSMKNLHCPGVFFFCDCGGIFKGKIEVSKVENNQF